MIWLTTMAVPLLGWWILTTQFQKIAVRLQKHWVWGRDFQTDCLRSFLLAFCHATPEHHLEALRVAPLNHQSHLLWLGLRSLGYGFIFVVLFGAWNVLPPSVVLLLGLVLFIAAQWWRPVWGLALFVLGVGLFLYGFEELLVATTRWRSGIDQFGWIFYLSENFFTGALIGVILGALIRFVFRLSGVAWWAGICLLLGGVLSLGGAWGFFIGEFLVSLAEDHLKHREKEVQMRLGVAAVFGILMLLLTTPFQSFVMSWINGGFSVQLRSLQLAGMIFIFLFLESLLSLVFFHFYFLKNKPTDLRR